MFTIEHTFDKTVITLVDEDKTPLLEDVVVNAFEDSVTLAQWDVVKGEMTTITLSLSQARDLEAALDLPEGVYRLRPAQDDPSKESI